MHLCRPYRRAIRIARLLGALCQLSPMRWQSSSGALPTPIVSQLLDGIGARRCLCCLCVCAREIGAECCDTQNLNDIPIQHEAANRSGWSKTEHM